jgi:hypothetical protein
MASPKASQGFSRPPMASQGLPRPPKASQGLPKPPKGSQGLARPPMASQGLPDLASRSHRDLVSSARLVRMGCGLRAASYALARRTKKCQLSLNLWSPRLREPPLAPSCPTEARQLVSSARLVRMGCGLRAASYALARRTKKCQLSLNLWSPRLREPRAPHPALRLVSSSSSSSDRLAVRFVRAAGFELQSLARRSKNVKNR